MSARRDALELAIAELEAEAECYPAGTMYGDDVLELLERKRAALEPVTLDEAIEDLRAAWRDLGRAVLKAILSERGSRGKG